MHIADLPVRRRLGLTPLIDVVFILLLFFMVATSFSRHGVLDLGAGRDGASTNTLKGAMLLTVGADGWIALNGIETDTERLAADLASLTSEEEMRILVRPVGAASTGDVARALDQLTAAGVADVTLVVPGG